MSLFEFYKVSVVIQKVLSSLFISENRVGIKRKKAIGFLVLCELCKILVVSKCSSITCTANTITISIMIFYLIKDYF